MQSEPDIRHAPIDLWRIMRAFMCTLHSLFGDPADIAKQQVMTTKHYKIALDWIRAGEAFLRHLLLIEAAAYAVQAPAAPRAPRPRQRRLVISDPDKPEEWRVSFRAFAAGDAALRRDAEQKASSPERVALSPSKGKAPRRFHDAWPIAERIEAIVRVFNDPAPYAKRLARKLIANPKLIRTLTRLPPNANNLVGYDAFPKAQPLCDQAEKKFEPG